MIEKQNYKRIVGIVVILIMANFLFVNFVYAADVLLNKATFDAAQTSQTTCNDLSTSVGKYTNGDYKAVWVAKDEAIKGGPGYMASAKTDMCYLEDSKVTTKVGPNYASVAANQLAEQIKAVTDPTKTLGGDAMKVVRDQEKNTAEVNKLNAQQKEDDGKSLIGSMVTWILEWIGAAISSIVGGFVGIAGKIMLSAIENSIGFADKQPFVVTVGWTVVRDVMNMMFILAMIVMSLATILRIEKYNYKNILVKLILMALLINFSLVIATAIISVFDVLIKLFMPPSALDIFVTLERMIGRGFVNSYTSMPGWGGVVGIFSQIIMLLAMLIVFIMLALLFVVRLIGLYALLILSPIAYALNILPATAEYSHKWWTTFFKYLIWGPVAMFFIRLTLILCNTIGMDADGKISSAGDSAWSYVLIIGFLFLTVQVAKQAGMAGSESIVSMAEKGMKGAAMLPLGAAKLGMGAFGRHYSKSMFRRADNATKAGQTVKAGFYKAAAFLNPTVAKKAWDERAHHLEEEAYAPAIGAAHDTLNRAMPTEWKWGKKEKVFNPETGKWEEKTVWMGRKTYFGRMGAESVINKKAKEINDANLSEEERVQLYLNAHDSVEKQAALKTLVTNRHADGLGITRDEQNGKEGADAYYDATRAVSQYAEDLSMHGKFSGEQVGEQGAHIVEMAEGQRMLRELGIAVNEWDGNFRMSSDFNGIRKLAGTEGGDKKIIDYLSDLNMLDDKGKFNGHEIRNLKDFESVLEKTKGEKDESGHNFAYELTGARMAKEARKRIMRGDTEDWAKAIEPAAFLRQNGDGTWGGYTAYGRRLMQMLPSGTVSAFEQGRRFQARSGYLAGFKVDKEGKVDIGKTNWDLMEETATLNPAALAALFKKAKLTDEQSKQIVATINDRPQVKAAGIRFEHQGADKWVFHKEGMAGAGGGGDGTSSGGGGSGVSSGGGGGGSSSPSVVRDSGKTYEKSSGGIYMPSGGGTATRTVTVENQTVNEIIRETNIKTEHHDAVQKAVKGVNHGDIDFGEAEQKFRELGMAVDQAKGAINKMKDALADVKVNAVPSQMTNPFSTYGADSASIKRAIKMGLMDAFKSGIKLGQPQVTNYISSSIKSAVPSGGSNIDGLIKDIAGEVNKPE